MTQSVRGPVFMPIKSTFCHWCDCHSWRDCSYFFVMPWPLSQHPDAIRSQARHAAVCIPAATQASEHASSETVHTRHPNEVQHVQQARWYTYCHPKISLKVGFDSRIHCLILPLPNQESLATLPLQFLWCKATYGQRYYMVLQLWKSSPQTSTTSYLWNCLPPNKCSNPLMDLRGFPFTQQSLLFECPWCVLKMDWIQR